MQRHSKWQQICVLNSHLDPIRDQNDVQYLLKLGDILQIYTYIYDWNIWLYSHKGLRTLVSCTRKHNPPTITFRYHRPTRFCMYVWLSCYLYTSNNEMSSYKMNVPGMNDIPNVLFQIWIKCKEHNQQINIYKYHIVVQSVSAWKMGLCEYITTSEASLTVACDPPCTVEYLGDTASNPSPYIPATI